MAGPWPCAPPKACQRIKHAAVVTSVLVHGINHKVLINSASFTVVGEGWQRACVSPIRDCSYSRTFDSAAHIKVFGNKTARHVAYNSIPTLYSDSF